MSNSYVKLQQGTDPNIYNTFTLNISFQEVDLTTGDSGDDEFLMPLDIQKEIQTRQMILSARQNETKSSIYQYQNTNFHRRHPISER